MSTPSTSDDAAVYQAKIIDQMIVTDDQRNIRVILTVTHTARLRNPKNLAAGSEPCDAKECEVWITLTRDDEKRLSRARRDLKSVGFIGDDFIRLHPDHPDGFRLVGRPVHVRCNATNGREYWNLAWPREQLSLDQMREAAEALKNKIALLGNGRVKAEANPGTAE
jgi:hypothetical protein